MASNSYRNAAGVLATIADTVIYTCPGGTVAIVNGLIVANVDAGAQDVAVAWTDESEAATLSLGSALAIPAGGAIQAIAKPLVLESGDSLVVTAAAAGVLHATASLLEIVSAETAA